MAAPKTCHKVARWRTLASIGAQERKLARLNAKGTFSWNKFRAQAD